MSQFYADPGDPAVVDAIVERQKNLTREEWQERLACLPSATAGEVSPAPRPGLVLLEAVIASIIGFGAFRALRRTFK